MINSVPETKQQQSAVDAVYLLWEQQSLEFSLFSVLLEGVFVSALQSVDCLLWELDDEKR